jgi:hypothetical protein
MKEFTETDVRPWANGKSLHADESELMDAPLAQHIRGLSQSASGYGAKLVTRYKICFERRTYRVYATCYSNSASHWFVVRGTKIFIN